MRKVDFDHVIAAAVEVCGEREIVVIGSQAILGSVESPPEVLVESMEADVYPLNAPEKAEEIDAVLGDGSPFHGSFGFYAHGVGPKTMKGPAGWQDRLVKVRVPLEWVRENSPLLTVSSSTTWFLRSAQRAVIVTGTTLARCWIWSWSSSTSCWEGLVRCPFQRRLAST